MDFWLTSSYRLITEDVLLLFDSFRLWRVFKSPRERTIQSYLDAVATIVREERKQEKVALRTYSRNHRYNSNSTDEDENISDTVLLWEFFRLVVLEYSFEELSQVNKCLLVMPGYELFEHPTTFPPITYSRECGLTMNTLSLPPLKVSFLGCQSLNCNERCIVRVFNFLGTTVDPMDGVPRAAAWYTRTLDR